MEDKENGLKRHLLLIIGVGLPFALIALVLGYRTFLTASIPAPRYAAVYAMTNQDYGPSYFKFDASNGHLSVLYTPPSTEEQKNQVRYNPPEATIYIQQDYTKPATRHLLKTPVTAKAMENNTISSDLSVELPDDLKKITIIPDILAPDGYAYTLDGRGRNGGGLFTELFISGAYRGDYPVITKDARIVPLIYATDRQPPYYYYGANNFKFLGWVKEPIAP